MSALNLLTGLTFLPYKDGLGLKAGWLLKLRNGKLVLVGHVNEADGSCGCCSDYLDSEKWIESYAVLCELPDPFPMFTTEERAKYDPLPPYIAPGAPPEPDVG